MVKIMMVYIVTVISTLIVNTLYRNLTFAMEITFQFY